MNLQSLKKLKKVRIKKMVSSCFGSALMNVFVFIFNYISINNTLNVSFSKCQPSEELVTYPMWDRLQLPCDLVEDE